ncbi:uncharacterized protein CDAR_255131 [Caerostris darwini]|uniref:Uncharacterized protein n=1 Tax=Caerostris darwini TaxID=1538125 RepID=A0AAV4VBD4_9ARAC|nr:uncharacterized protein CDAR_255131 [Caerostris darwini]
MQQSNFPRLGDRSVTEDDTTPTHVFRMSHLVDRGFAQEGSSSSWHAMQTSECPIMGTIQTALAPRGTAQKLTLGMANVRGFCFLSFLFVSCTAFELQQKETDVQSPRGIGLEEIVLFLIGLGVASALGLALMIGPMFAIFYSSVHGLPFGGINGAGGSGNTITTTAGGSRHLEIPKEVKKLLAEKLSEGVRLLSEALQKYNSS